MPLIASARTHHVSTRGHFLAGRICSYASMMSAPTMIARITTLRVVTSRAMNRVQKLLANLPELLRRDAAGEPPLWPPVDPLQYARFLVPDLTGKPWHDAHDFAFTRAFEANHAAIRAELEAFLAQQRVTF